jgi:hypothetical protein
LAACGEPTGDHALSDGQQWLLGPQSRVAQLGNKDAADRFAPKTKVTTTTESTTANRPPVGATVIGTGNITKNGRSL